MDTHIRVSLNQDYRFSVEILNFHGPGVHLEVLLVLAASWVLLGWGVTVCAIRFGEWLRG